MRVRVLSGLQLTMNADQVGGPDKRRWVAQTEFSNVLTSKYQVQFSLWFDHNYRFIKYTKYLGFEK